MRNYEKWAREREGEGEKGGKTEIERQKERRVKENDWVEEDGETGR